LLHQPLPHSATAEKQAYTSEINLMRLDQWWDSPRHPQMELIDKTFPFKTFWNIQNVPKAVYRYI
jgi:hypothetical protein